MAGLHNSNNNETVKAICRHAFLQIMMQSGYMKLEDAKKMFAEISKGGFDFVDIVSDINVDISVLGFELRQAKDFSNVRYLGFVNKEADEASKKASRYKLKDGKVDVNYAAFFKALLEKIESCEQHDEDVAFVTSQDVYYVPIVLPEVEGSQTATAPFKMTDRQHAVERFVADGWLANHPTLEDAFCLGPRALLEIGPSMREKMVQKSMKRRMEQVLGYA